MPGASDASLPVTAVAGRGTAWTSDEGPSATLVAAGETAKAPAQFVQAAGGTVALPDASIVGVLALSLGVAMLIVGFTLTPLERMTRPASIRHE